jgi:hypothetical protein
MVFHLDHRMTCSAANAPTSTIVQLLYAAVPPIRFPGLLGHLCETLCGTLGYQARLIFVGEGTAHLDLGQHRLTLGLHRDLPGAARQCVTLGIGPQPKAGAAPVGTEALAFQTEIARKLSEAITRRLPADQILWHIAPQPLTAGLIDALIDRLPPSLPRPGDSSDDRVDLSRVMEQVQVTLSGKSSPRPRPAAQGNPATVMAFPRSAKADLPKTTAARLTPPGPSGLWPGRRQTGAAARRTASATLLAFVPRPTVTAPANDTPALPRPDQTGRLKTLIALDHGQSRAATRLILTAGKSAARVEASLSQAC